MGMWQNCQKTLPISHYQGNVTSESMVSPRSLAVADSTYKFERVRGMPVSDEELLSDLRSVASRLDKKTVGQKEYRQIGKYDDTTASSRFGTWNNALRAAGLTVSNEVNISDDRLYENVLALWQHYGRQPRRGEVASPPSTISQGPYRRRFGSWTASLEAFVNSTLSDQNTCVRTCG